MTENKHIGSSFESFLESEGIFEEVDAAAQEAIIERLREKTMNPIGEAESKDSAKRPANK